MTQEEKQLLLQDLSARLTYGIKVQVCNLKEYSPTVKGLLGDNLFLQFDYNIKPVKNGDSTYNIINDNVKPYLRPISSMTEEEKKELSKKYVWNICCGQIKIRYHSEGYWDDDTECPTKEYIILFNWLNAHHLDYRGLISMGLALEAPKDMY